MDKKGQVLFVASKWFPVTYDILMGEAIVVLIGMKLALEVGFASLEVENDNIQVPHALQWQSHSISKLGMILDDIREPSGSFFSISFTHCARYSS